MENLKKVTFSHELENGKILQNLNVFYQTFGPEIGSAPIVLVNHALTGNSNVSGKNGWWQELIGYNKTIDLNNFTVIAINIPGNGFDQDPENLIENYRDFTAKDIASIFWKTLENLKVGKLFAVIGGSLGGGIAWEMSALRPTSIQNLIPVATDWKATDWVIANVLIQDKILNNSNDPIPDARLHAMLLYRTPQSLALRFNRETSGKEFKIENWLVSHGEKLQNRFTLSAYKLMNHLLKTIDISRNRGSFIDIASHITANIHIVSVDTDYFYVAHENKATITELLPFKTNVFHHEIQSIHGHDAFLIESQQLSQILSPIFSNVLSS
ncbi:MAG: alpha/beta fold hydrolase [Flavobacterium sp.]|uniref:alpha/beta fold hydrolase n=1 Tax=Flavobacterium sp. TaxID=239 RepID=UPI0012191A65|nr:alpha/beta fold hydrolase [Flavobacterium sp.]RZJ66463.1 MAG: alpha/beta fold hydrolase [Flavobacterium sp.]